MKMHDNHPEMIVAVMKASDCEIIDTWHTIGMKATDSNDVSAKDVFVPEYLSFPLSPNLRPIPVHRSALPVSGKRCQYCLLLSSVSLALAKQCHQGIKVAGRK
jgi:hypothetical protein